MHSMLCAWRNKPHAFVVCHLAEPAGSHDSLSWLLHGNLWWDTASTPCCFPFLGLQFSSFHCCLSSSWARGCGCNMTWDGDISKGRLAPADLRHWEAMTDSPRTWQRTLVWMKTSADTQATPPADFLCFFLHCCFCLLSTWGTKLVNLFFVAVPSFFSFKTGIPDSWIRGWCWCNCAQQTDCKSDRMAFSPLAHSFLI